MDWWMILELIFVGICALLLVMNWMKIWHYCILVIPVFWFDYFFNPMMLEATWRGPVISTAVALLMAFIFWKAYAQQLEENKTKTEEKKEEKQENC